MTAAAAAEGVAELQSGWDDDPHPWRRYGARSIDVTLFSSIFTFAAAFVGVLIWPAMTDFLVRPPVLASLLALAPIGIIVSALGVAACHTMWGTTPGKWIFRLKLERAGDGKLSFARAIKREAILVVWGFGFGLPFISLLTLAVSYSDLENEGATRWDRAVGGRSSARMIQGFAYVWLAVGVLLVIAGKAIGLIGMVSR